MAENSTSKVAAVDQPPDEAISAEADVSAESRAGAAPLTTKDAPGSPWNTAVTLRSVLKSWAQAKRMRSVRTAFGSAKERSVRMPSSVREAVTFFAAKFSAKA